jgi:hypothetical protein
MAEADRLERIEAMLAELAESQRASMLALRDLQIALGPWTEMFKAALAGIDEIMDAAAEQRTEMARMGDLLIEIAAKVDVPPELDEAGGKAAALA